MSPDPDSLQASATMIGALTAPGAWPHPVADIHIIETHISWIVLTGQYAYKLKKPLDLGFLDFSTLDARRAGCEQEVLLNRRTAPTLYLGVVPITGTVAHPQVDGPGAPIDYAVRMRQFDPRATLDAALAAGCADATHIDRLADAVARFHDGATRMNAASLFGRPELVLEQAIGNLDALAACPAATVGNTIDQLRSWTLDAHAQLLPVMNTRRSAGFVRDCHGDLHLGNVALIDDAPVPFDCIEFNAQLRCIDVASEIAFTFMDLHDHARPDLAFRFLDRYMMWTGDYGAFALLRFYSVYRTLVRAKVAAIRLSQSAPDAATASDIGSDVARHIALARRLSEPSRPRLVLTSGPSGSGKSTVAGMLLEGLGAARLRSDVERKRIHGIAPDSPSSSGVDDGIYSATATGHTYDHLALLTRDLLAAGMPVVVDATFLERSGRDRFRSLARDLRIPCTIVWCTAPADVLRSRVATRAAAGGDPSEAGPDVLEQQLARTTPPGPDETGDVVLLDTSGTLAEVAAAVRALASGLRNGS